MNAKRAAALLTVLSAALVPLSVLLLQQREAPEQTPGGESGASVSSGPSAPLRRSGTFWAPVPAAKPMAGPGADSGPALVPLTLECTEDGRCGECRDSSECPSGQGCVLNPERRRLVCLPGNCKTADDCSEGEVCLAHNSATGASVRRCAEAGILPEGAECPDPTGPPETRCALGLVCVLERCGQPCDPKTKHPCTASETCVTMVGEGSGCYATCSTDDDCARGKVCRGGGRLSQCVEQLGPDCPALQCLPPSRCEGSFGAGQVSYECVTPCDPFSQKSQCSNGFVCGASGTQSRCYQRCTSAANDCPPGRLCVPVMEDRSQYGCVSSLRIRPVLTPAHPNRP
jgi:hypothetical protein